MPYKRKKRPGSEFVTQNYKRQATEDNKDSESVKKYIIYSNLFAYTLWMQSYIFNGCKRYVNFLREYYYMLYE